MAEKIKIYVICVAVAAIIIVPIYFIKQNIDCSNDINSLNDLNLIQIKLLADEIVKNTPEFPPIEENTRFPWVVLHKSVFDNPKHINKAVINELRTHYTVYLKLKDVPDSKMQLDDNGHIITCKDGFLFNYEIKFEKNETLHVEYGDYKAKHAARSHWKKYYWMDCNWKIINVSGITVSKLNDNSIDSIFCTPRK